jgi:outer membrane protein assembly factor BamB
MSSERPWYRRRIVIVLAAFAAVLVCGAIAFALTRPGDVFNPDVEFRAEPTETSVPTPEATKNKKKPKKTDPLAGFQWAQYGYSRDRRRYLPADPSVAPPWHKRWYWDANVLLEFPPIIVGNRLFLTKNDGVVVALNRETGKVVWKRDMGYLAASSPAYGEKKIVVTVLERSKGGAGRVAALWAKSGKVAWSKPLASRSESSPLIVDHHVYFGTENGDVYSMRLNDAGSVQWKFHAGGAVKGGLALWEGKLYFGTYGGQVYAIGQRSGKQVWHTGTSGANFGLSAGNFYATPAVAYGRVYIGNTDGNMYSFSAETGKLAWRRGTGSYVYASPAVAQVPNSKPTVYFGSYDGTFYALDARSGATRWTYRDGGKISGAATVVGNIVYYSNWGKRNTSALGAITGRHIWTSEAGAFNPVVSDGQDIYLTGFASVQALEPLTKAQERARAQRIAKKKAAEKKRKAAKKKKQAAKKKKSAAAKKKQAAKKKAAAKKKKQAAKKKAAKKKAAKKKKQQGSG